MSYSRTAPIPAPRVQLRPNLDKVFASLCYLIGIAEAHGYAPTQYDLVKSLFLADKAHLNKFGRPITFDNYVAMVHGPVPSLAYDLLKENEVALSDNEIKELPWQRTSAEHVGKGCFHYHSTNPVLKEDLSESDLTLLQTSFDAIMGLTFRQVRELTHNDEAYKEAWSFVGDAKRNLMSLGLLFDKPDFGAAQDIEFASHQQAMCGNLSDDYIDSLGSRNYRSGRHS